MLCKLLSVDCIPTYQRLLFLVSLSPVLSRSLERAGSLIWLLLMVPSANFVAFLPMLKLEFGADELSIALISSKFVKCVLELH